MGRSYTGALTGILGGDLLRDSHACVSPEPIRHVTLHSWLESVNVDLSSLIAEAVRLRGFPANAKKAVQRATGTLARRLPVEARRDIQTEYNLSAARIRSGLSVRQGDGFIELTASKRGIGLIEFGGKWAGRKSEGATAQVFVGEARHNYGGTFIAVGRSGNRHIFSRGFAGGKRAGRLPLHALYGPSLAQILRKGDRKTRLGDLAQSILSSEITRLL